MSNVLCKLGYHKPDKEKEIHLPVNYSGRIDASRTCRECGKHLEKARVVLDL